MATIAESQPVLWPAHFSRQLLQAMEASEGRRKRRKRDTTPDAIGMGIKRELLRRAVEENPSPEEFEAWLFEQALASPAGGPVRALCREILDEYRLAGQDPDFGRWLAAGAPSEDAAPDRASGKQEQDAAGCGPDCR